MELREKVCVDKMGSRALREKVCVDKMGSRAWREKVCVDKMGSGAVQQHNNNATTITVHASRASEPF